MTLSSAELLVLPIAAIIFVWAGWQDFLTWKIRNSTVLLLIALYAIFAAARYVSAFGEPLALKDIQTAMLGEVGAAVLLFLLGFALWMFRLFGAGDAKLFFAIGLFVGYSHLIVFAIVLAIAAAVVTILLKIRIPSEYQAYKYIARLEEIRSTGKIPYGVLMALATIIAMYFRYFVR